MRKMWMISAIVIPSCLFLGGTKHAGSYRIEKLAQHLYAVIDLYHPSPGGTVNAAFLTTQNSLVFIDAGMNQDSAEAIWTEAHKRFPEKTKNYLILTHFHCDHTFCMGFFKARGTKVIAHREIDPWLDQEKFKKRLLKTRGKVWTFPQIIAFETYPGSLGKLVLRDEADGEETRSRARTSRSFDRCPWEQEIYQNPGESSRAGRGRGGQVWAIL